MKRSNRTPFWIFFLRIFFGVILLVVLFFENLFAEIRSVPEEEVILPEVFRKSEYSWINARFFFLKASGWQGDFYHYLAECQHEPNFTNSVQNLNGYIKSLSQFGHKPKVRKLSINDLKKIDFPVILLMEPEKDSVFFACYVGYENGKIWLLDCASVRVAPIQEEVFRIDWSGIVFYPDNKSNGFITLLKYISVFLFVVIIVYCLCVTILCFFNHRYHSKPRSDLGVY
jgi:hypothetical protein